MESKIRDLTSENENLKIQQEAFINGSRVNDAKSKQDADAQAETLRHMESEQAQNQQRLKELEAQIEELKQEKDSVQSEKETMQSEKDTLEGEIAAIQGDKEA